MMIGYTIPSKIIEKDRDENPPLQSTAGDQLGGEGWGREVMRGELGFSQFPFPVPGFL